MSVCVSQYAVVFVAAFVHVRMYVTHSMLEVRL